MCTTRRCKSTSLHKSFRQVRPAPSLPFPSGIDGDKKHPLALGEREGAVFAPSRSLAERCAAARGDRFGYATPSSVCSTNITRILFLSRRIRSTHGDPLRLVFHPRRDRIPQSELRERPALRKPRERPGIGLEGVRSGPLALRTQHQNENVSVLIHNQYGTMDPFFITHVCTLNRSGSNKDETTLMLR